METTNPRLTVLLVDDDDDFRFQMEAQLRAAGYDVVAAGSRAEAEERLAETKPAAAVLDLMMEELDGGFVLAHHVKRIDPSIPVVLVTAVASETGLSFDAPDSAERSWVKADAVLAKPVRFEQLQAALTRLLGPGAGGGPA